MGGLISRAYLAGLQANQTAAPPANPMVRKLVQIATPNFGSFIAANFAPSFLGLPAQAAEMVPGTAFLWNLARWNQGGDDLRGVDAIAIIGNAGTFNGTSNASDGIVTLTSASLGFARDPSRTRILPYCHIASDFVANSILGTMDCSGNGIANVDQAPETGNIIRSFLAGTTTWTTIGNTPTQDPFLSQDGGVYFAEANAADQYATDLTQVLWGNVGLSNGGSSGGVFYDEFISGKAAVQATSKSLGTSTCGPYTEAAGYYNVVRCKSGPAISSITPLLSNAPGIVVASGEPVTINGSGFGAQLCAGCQALLYPGGSPLAVSSWSDQSIVATLPASVNGFYQIAVQTASGQDGVNLLSAPDTIPPFGFFDTPANNASVVGNVGVTGWALDNVVVQNVDIWRDPLLGEATRPNGLVYVGDAVFITGTRPDVQGTYPNYPNNNRAGWGFSLLTNTLPNSNGSAGDGNGTYNFHAIAHDAAGNSTELGVKTLLVNNAASPLPFGAIDTPGQGATISGSAYVNFGWALTPQPNIVPLDGSTIWVYIDNQPVGHPVYDNYRSDIATIFPNYRNSGGAVGYYMIDTTKLTNGLHNIQWSITDSAGHTTGVGSRYFIVQN
jgi:hypothetical protein